MVVNARKISASKTTASAIIPDKSAILKHVVVKGVKIKFECHNLYIHILILIHKY